MKKIAWRVFALFLLSLPPLAAFSPAASRYAPPEGMVFVEGGCFDMGDTFGDGAVSDGEKPAHRVCLNDFFMDKYEVKQSAYAKVAGQNPSNVKNCPDCPVEQVSWEKANAYCGNVGKRLPTEAEWEYAARERGKKARFGTGKEKTGPDEANYNASTGYAYARKGEWRKKTLPVGSFPPNALELYDMSGNVAEWVADWHDANYYKQSQEQNPKGPPSGENRVLRGGSWSHSAYFTRAASRLSSAPDSRGVNNGFRCSQTP